jgi:hypothetical protein
MDPPENNLWAVVTCTFENVGSEMIDLEETFLGDLRSDPDDELLDSELYLSESYWDGAVWPDATVLNSYTRSSGGAYVSGMGGSDFFVIVVTVIDEDGHTLEVTTPPAEAGWGA